MRTYVAEINGVALIAFRARGDNEVYDKNGNLQLGLNGFSGVVRPDGGPLWDGDPHLGDRDQLAAGPNPFGREKPERANKSTPQWEAIGMLLMSI